MNGTSYPRHMEARLRESLADSPVVLIQGPRQCGKTTLAQTVGLAAGYEYISFDDRAVCDSGGGDTGGAADLGGGIEYRTPTVHIRLAGPGHIQGQAADEQRATLTVRKSSGDFDLSINLAADDSGIDTARLLTSEWRF